MGAAKQLNIDIIRSLVPLNSLAPINLQKLLPKINIQTFPKNHNLFKIGDRDSYTYYLLEGDMEMISEDKSSYLISTGEPIAFHPLAHYQPRQVTAKTLTQCVVAIMDSNLLDVLLTWDQSSGYEVADIENNADGSDWMTRMLQSKSLEKLPASNIQKLLLKMEETEVHKGHTIIKEGDMGEQYYLIKKGNATVTKTSKSGKKVIVAELKEGDFFGEDALLSEEKRNATVKMTTEGIIMSLDRSDFDDLLKTPLVNEINYAQAAELSLQGAIWVDVRMPDEFKHSNIYGSQNIPLFAIRQNVGILDMGKPYIIYCDTGRRSAAAGFLLSQRGFDVYVLFGGISNVPDDKFNCKPKNAEILSFNKDTINKIDQEIVNKHKNEIEFLKGDVEQLNMQLNQAKQRTLEFEKLLRVKDTELLKLEKRAAGRTSTHALERQLLEKNELYESQVLLNEQLKLELDRNKASIKALTRSLDEAEQRVIDIQNKNVNEDDINKLVDAKVKKYKIQTDVAKQKINELSEENIYLSKTLDELKLEMDKLKETQPEDDGDSSRSAAVDSSQDDLIRQLLNEKMNLSQQLGELLNRLDSTKSPQNLEGLQSEINRLKEDKKALIENNRRLQEDYNKSLQKLNKS